MNFTAKTWALSLAFLIGSTGCAYFTKKISDGTSTSTTKTVSIMTFNVENLFDLEDDPNKNDDAYLPSNLKSSLKFINGCRAKNDVPRFRDECLKKDWNARVLNRKMERITDVVAQVGDGRGPDILILQEVENLNVLTQWRDKYMQKMGYQTIAFVEGPDERGIDTAVMSRLPLIKPATLHEVDLTDVKSKDAPPAARARPTRGVLEAHLQLPNGEPLVVFAVHFPSQGAPTPARIKAVDVLLKAIAALPPHTQMVAGGDYNISAKEEHRERFFAEKLGPNFAVSHLVGCKDCVGSIYYPKDKTWSFFDVLMFQKSMNNGLSNWQLDRESIRLINTSIYQMSNWGTPARFGNGTKSVGVSDHWPVYAEIKIKTPEHTVAQ